MLAVIKSADGKRQETFHNFTLTSVGVIVSVAKHSEFFFPWHRVVEIYSDKPGEIMNEFVIKDNNNA